MLIVLRITAAADRRSDAALGESVGVAHREILPASVAMMHEPIGRVVAAGVDRLLEGIQDKVRVEAETRQPTIRGANTSITTRQKRSRATSLRT